MARFILGRLLLGVGTLFAVATIVFFSTQVLPGDVAQAVLGRDATPEAVAVVRERMGIDRPLPTQFADWLAGLFRGDFGVSLAASSTGLIDQVEGDEIPATTFVWTPLRNTVALMLATTALLIPLSIVLGLAAAIFDGRLVDRVIGTTTLVILSIPDFVAAVILILLFALVWPILPAVSLVDPERSVLSQPEALILPALTLLAAMLAQTARMVRAGVLQTISADFVQLAPLRGLHRTVIWRRYILRNALAASVQVFAINIAWMFGGIIVIESVFQYPGIGLQLVQSLSARDIPVVQAIALTIAGAYVLINIAADVATMLLTPKLRTSP